MKKTAAAAFLLLTLLALNSCSALPKAKDGMQTVTNKAVDFSFACPNEWSVTRNDAVVAILSPKDRSNLTVTSFELKDTGMAVNAYFDSYQKDFESAFGKMDILNDKETKLDGIPARHITYTNSLGKDKYKSDMLITIRKGVVYTVTFTATPDTYDNNIAVFKQAKDSFHFK